MINLHPIDMASIASNYPEYEDYTYDEVLVKCYQDYKRLNHHTSKVMPLVYLKNRIASRLLESSIILSLVTLAIWLISHPMVTSTNMVMVAGYHLTH